MSEIRTVSVVTVTYNAMQFLPAFLDSLWAVDQERIQLDVVVVDNGSSDGSVDWLRSQSNVQLIQNDENNYARALNLAIAASQGEYVAIVNNDATLDPNWLQGFFSVFNDAGEAGDKIGAVQSKIYFAGDAATNEKINEKKDETKKINSVGVEEVEHYYFRDIGFDEPDSSRYSKPSIRDYVTGGSVLFRRAALDDVGLWDESFIMFMEDVDYSARARKKGWELWYAPQSQIFHQYHGSSSDQLCEYFCTRNRFFFVAKHFPLELAECIPSSHFYKKGELDLLYRSLLHATRIVCTTQDAKTVQTVLESLEACLPGYIGAVSTHNFFSQLEIVLGLRKLRVGIYDHAGHFAGGGQRYVAEMAAIMQDRYDITYIFNNDVHLDSYKDWFDLDLSRCKMKIIRIPFFDERERYTADEGMVLGEKHNVFDVIARDTLNYDIFINANMLGKVNPLSAASMFVCHFPDQEKSLFFQVDQYDHLIINGDYTGSWVKKRWALEPTHKLYPPVNMYNPQSSIAGKENIILSVSRFEISGSKKQIELVQSFSQMCKDDPKLTADWKLVLVGGSTPRNTYLDELRAEIDKAGCQIEVWPNAAVQEIKDFYSSASLFWHACGLDESRPERVEHFGMTTVESMQNYCVPIVIDGGGQREIVEQGDSGFRFANLEELQTFSFRLMADRAEREAMAEKAFERSHLFSRDVFQGHLEALLEETENALLGHDRLP